MGNETTKVKVNSEETRVHRRLHQRVGHVDAAHVTRSALLPARLLHVVPDSRGHRLVSTHNVLSITLKVVWRNFQIMLRSLARPASHSIRRCSGLRVFASQSRRGFHPLAGTWDSEPISRPISDNLVPMVIEQTVCCIMFCMFSPSLQL